MEGLDVDDFGTIPPLMMAPRLGGIKETILYFLVLQICKYQVVGYYRRGQYYLILPLGTSLQIEPTFSI